MPAANDNRSLVQIQLTPQFAHTVTGVLKKAASCYSALTVAERESLEILETTIRAAFVKFVAGV